MSENGCAGDNHDAGFRRYEGNDVQCGKKSGDFGDVAENKEHCFHADIRHVKGNVSDQSDVDENADVIG